MRNNYNNNRGGQGQGQYNNQNQNQQNMMNQMPQVQQQRNTMPPQPGMIPPQPVAKPPMPGAGAQPGMPTMPAMPVAPQQMTANMPVAQKYQLAAAKYLPAVDDRNPLMKEQVGNTIYEYVTELVGQQKAPKITGMLINLPLEQVRQFMRSYDALRLKVTEANQLLEHQM